MTHFDADGAGAIHTIRSAAIGLGPSVNTANAHFTRFDSWMPYLTLRAAMGGKFNGSMDHMLGNARPLFHC
jgi:hypothetical protein